MNPLDSIICSKPLGTKRTHHISIHSALYTISTLYTKERMPLHTSMTLTLRCLIFILMIQTTTARVVKQHDVSTKNNTKQPHVFGKTQSDEMLQQRPIHDRRELSESSARIRMHSPKNTIPSGTLKMSQLKEPSSRYITVWRDSHSHIPSIGKYLIRNIVSEETRA